MCFDRKLGEAKYYNDVSVYLICLYVGFARRVWLMRRLDWNRANLLTYTILIDGF